MTEMIERVASAIGATISNRDRTVTPWTMIAARVAIEAMREPTPEMQRAWCGPYPWDEEAMEIWQAMIDAALGKGIK